MSQSRSWTSGTSMREVTATLKDKRRLRRSLRVSLTCLGLRFEILKGTFLFFRRCSRSMALPPFNFARFGRFLR